MGELSSEAQTKLLCSLPGIEHSLLGVVQTLSSLATESADSAARMSRRISELSAEVKGLKEELVTLKASAIAKSMSSSRPRSRAVGAGHATTSGKPSTAVTGDKLQHSTVHRSTDSAKTPLATPVATDSAGDAHRTGSCESHAAAKHADMCATGEDANRLQNTGLLGNKQQQQRSVPPLCPDSDIWTTVSNHKPRGPKKAIFFVGNLKRSTTADQLTTLYPAESSHHH